jgi:hypothetical protein
MEMAALYYNISMPLSLVIVDIKFTPCLYVHLYVLHLALAQKLKFPFSKSFDIYTQGQGP